MRLLILLLFAGGLHAQEKRLIDGTEYIITPVGPLAQNLEYWGKKGIAADPYIKVLELENSSLKSQIKFQDFIIENHKNASSQYREMVERLAKDKIDLTKQMISIEKDRDIFKDRARQRGYALALIATAAGIMTFVGLK